ncbi:HD-like signal output (HDOD) domain, no enzymatic activity [Marinobacterium sediminicola]|uniref:HD-like signal output (HDOD) domain, no enzymatic activity n=2 Tax=Marinobacterium sediminicola TaxID=518898 RepID=A0ABY1RZU4_9GAMM|nr:HD-like signal output (HDOD) domain, no enzymatic activity [Marinobacterium sediminicola]
MIELLNRADSLHFEAGSNLWEQRPELAQRMLLVMEGGLNLNGVSESPIEIPAGLAINALSEFLSDLRGVALEASVRSHILVLSRSQFEQLREQTQITLLQRGQSAVVRIMSALMEEQASLRQSCRQLSVNALVEMRGQQAGLERSDGLQAIIERIPRLPVSSLELMERLLDQDSTHGQVIEMVREDPAMTATLLKAINSPAYNFGHQVTDVSHAVTLLGYEGVYQIIMAETLRKALPDTEGFRASHQRAVTLSYIAFAMAQLTGRARPAELSTIALLHDIGRVVLAVMQSQQPASKPFIRQTPSGVAGGLLLQSWLLPEAIWKVVAQQHYPYRLPPEQLPSVWRDAVALIHLSSWVLEYLNKQSHSAPFIEAYQRQLGLDPMTSQKLWQQKLVPLLSKRRNALPASLRRMLG